MHLFLFAFYVILFTHTGGVDWSITELSNSAYFLRLPRHFACIYIKHFKLLLCLNYAVYLNLPRPVSPLKDCIKYKLLTALIFSTLHGSDC